MPPERNAYGGLTDSEIDAIVDRAARKAVKLALQQVYAEVGERVLRKLAWLVGIVVVSLAIWMAGRGTLWTGPH